MIRSLKNTMVHPKSGPGRRAMLAGYAPAPSRFLLTHFWAPAIALIFASIALTLLQGDTWMADRLYAWQGHRWALKWSFGTEQVVHLLGRDLSAMAWLGVFAAWIVAQTRDAPLRWRRSFAYLAVATLLATALVAWVKAWSNMDCPWDLVRYGGDRPYIGLFALRPVGLARGACFPAGHASGGYAWMALYFFFLATRPQLRWLGLSLGMALGLVFGFSQQLRGAHFLSHDLWTAAICWFTALGVYLLFGMPSASLGARIARDEEEARARASWEFAK